MLTWTPGKQSLADFIDFEHDGKTYLIGVGQYDGSVWIIKLKSGGSGTKIPLNVLLHGWAGLAVAGVYTSVQLAARLCRERARSFSTRRLRALA